MQWHACRSGRSQVTEETLLHSIIEKEHVNRRYSTESSGVIFVYMKTCFDEKQVFCRIRNFVSYATKAFGRMRSAHIYDDKEDSGETGKNNRSSGTGIMP